MAAAAWLFARHGYHGVGVRDIAREAEANVAMISYYFSGKVGVLKEIVRECLEWYSKEVRAQYRPSGTVEEQVLSSIRAVIRLFRERGELALVAFDVIPSDPPEVWQYKVKLSKELSADLADINRLIGLDRADLARLTALKSVFAGILVHFQGLHAIGDTPELQAFAAGLDDAFYERLARDLTTMYLALLGAERGAA